MTPSCSSLLTDLYAAGFRLWEERGQLAIAPRAKMTPELRARVQAHRSKLLTWVSPSDPAPELHERLHAAAAWATAAGLHLAAVESLRPRSAVPVAVAWPAAAADFCLLLKADDLPEVSFRLNDWTEICDAGKFLRWLQADIRRGPSGPRAVYGALQGDLLALQRFVLQAAKIRENWRRTQR